MASCLAGGLNLFNLLTKNKPLWLYFDRICRAVTGLYDLHTHSSCSDGILRPQALVSRAKVKGVTTLALTDHDTLAGLAEAQRAASEEDNHPYSRDRILLPVERCGHSYCWP